jgi:hypothetical protein
MTRTTTGIRHIKRVVGLGLGIAAATMVVGMAAVPDVLAQPLPTQVAPPQAMLAQSTSVTPAETTGEAALPVTLQVTEGRYRKAGSPETGDLVQDGTHGMPMTLPGQVFDQSGAPVPNAAREGADAE